MKVAVHESVGQTGVGDGGGRGIESVDDRIETPARFEVERVAPILDDTREDPGAISRIRQSHGARVGELR